GSSHRGLHHGTVRLRKKRFDDVADGALDAAQRETESALVERDRLARALMASGMGIIVVDATGNEVVRSGSAERFRKARHGDAVAQELVDRLLRGALHGAEASEELALFGPPRETLIVHAQPLPGAARLPSGAAAHVGGA